MPDPGALDSLCFRYRAALLVLPAAGLVWAALEARRPAALELGLGAALALAGAGLRLAAIRRIGKRARVARARPHSVIASGPYAWTRSPLYLAACLILLGLGLAAGLGTWALLPAAIAGLVYDRAVRYEEQALVAALGEEAATYLASVPRWFPRRPARPPAFDQLVPASEVLRREWRLLVGIPAALAALTALALLPASPPQDLARRAAAATGLPLAVLVALAAAIGAVLNALKTRALVARRERRQREQRAAARREEVGQEVRSCDS